MLASQFRNLREARGGKPVFLIEHGLDMEGVAELQEMVGRNLRQVGLDSNGWLGITLPLTVAITEVGYTYRGTGTDFWPKVSSALNADIHVGERAEVSRIFATISDKLGVARPFHTDWSRAYNHIAWPIRNALAPVEIHRPLTAALRQVLSTNSSLRTDEELLLQLREIASGLWSKRLSDWLEDETLSVGLCKSLLYGEDHKT